MSKCALTDNVAQLLKNAGLSDQVIQQATFDTLLFHDLGLYGDTAWCFVEELEKTIDMSEFRFDQFFPPEFHGESFAARIVNSLIPFANWLYRKKKSYTPLSLRMIAKCIEKGSWDIGTKCSSEE